MSRRLEDDTLKIFWLDVSVTVFIKQVECLTDPLALQSSQHLCELRVSHIMSLFLSSDIQCGPFTVPVKGYAIGTLVELIQLPEIIVFDSAGTSDIE